MCIHFRFQNVHSFSFSKCERFCDFCFSFFRKTQQHNCKQTAVHSLQIVLLMRLWTNNEIYIKLLNLFLLSRIYNLLHLDFDFALNQRQQCDKKMASAMESHGPMRLRSWLKITTEQKIITMFWLFLTLIGYRYNLSDDFTNQVRSTIIYLICAWLRDPLRDRNLVQAAAFATLHQDSVILNGQIC